MEFVGALNCEFAQQRRHILQFHSNALIVPHWHGVYSQQPGLARSRSPEGPAGRASGDCRSSRESHQCAQRTRLSAANVERLLAGHGVVIDGSDIFSTRYLVDDTCARLGVPLVYGAVQGFNGQVGVFWPAHESGSCYCCLFPELPSPEFAPNCSEASVLGVLPGVISLLQATEAIKLILGIGECLSGTLLPFDRLRLERDRGCPRCSEGVTPADYVDLPEPARRTNP